MIDWFSAQLAKLLPRWFGPRDSTDPGTDPSEADDNLDEK